MTLPPCTLDRDRSRRVNPRATERKGYSVETPPDILRRETLLYPHPLTSDAIENRPRTGAEQATSRSRTQRSRPHAVLRPRHVASRHVFPVLLFSGDVHLKLAASEHPGGRVDSPPEEPHPRQNKAAHQGTIFTATVEGDTESPRPWDPSRHKTRNRPHAPLPPTPRTFQRGQTPSLTPNTSLHISGPHRQQSRTCRTSIGSSSPTHESDQSILT